MLVLEVMVVLHSILIQDHGFHFLHEFLLLMQELEGVMERQSDLHLIQCHTPSAMNEMILEPMVAEICDVKISCDLVPEEEESIKMTEGEVVEDVVYELLSVEPIIDNGIVYNASIIETLDRKSIFMTDYMDVAMYLFIQLRSWHNFLTKCF